MKSLSIGMYCNNCNVIVIRIHQNSNMFDFNMQEIHLIEYGNPRKSNFKYDSASQPLEYKNKASKY